MYLYLTNAKNVSNVAVHLLRYFKYFQLFPLIVSFKTDCNFFKCIWMNFIRMRGNCSIFSPGTYLFNKTKSFRKEMCLSNSCYFILFIVGPSTLTCKGGKWKDSAGKIYHPPSTPYYDAISGRNNFPTCET